MHVTRFQQQFIRPSRRSGNCAECPTTLASARRYSASQVRFCSSGCPLAHHRAARPASDPERFYRDFQCTNWPVLVTDVSPDFKEAQSLVQSGDHGSELDLEALEALAGDVLVPVRAPHVASSTRASKPPHPPTHYN